jgi:hypothetical protein
VSSRLTAFAGTRHTLLFLPIYANYQRTKIGVSAGITSGNSHRRIPAPRWGCFKRAELSFSYLIVWKITPPPPSRPTVGTGSPLKSKGRSDSVVYQIITPLPLLFKGRGRGNPWISNKPYGTLHPHSHNKNHTKT